VSPVESINSSIASDLPLESQSQADSSSSFVSEPKVENLSKNGDLIAFGILIVVSCVLILLSFVE
jgi:hypothetical protein